MANDYAVRKGPGQVCFEAYCYSVKLKIMNWEQLTGPVQAGWIFAAEQVLKGFSDKPPA